MNRLVCWKGCALIFARCGGDCTWCLGRSSRGFSAVEARAEVGSQTHSGTLRSRPPRGGSPRHLAAPAVGISTLRQPHGHRLVCNRILFLSLSLHVFSCFSMHTNALDEKIRVRKAYESTLRVFRQEKLSFHFKTLLLTDSNEIT